VTVGKSTTFIEIIPEPKVVRERLGQTVREAQILRQLLKVSERAAKEREQQKVVPNVRP
jgi:hypothetical protein